MKSRYVSPKEGSHLTVYRRHDDDSALIVSDLTDILPTELWARGYKMSLVQSRWNGSRRVLLCDRWEYTVACWESGEIPSFGELTEAAAAALKG